MKKNLVIVSLIAIISTSSLVGILLFYNSNNEKNSGSVLFALNLSNTDNSRPHGLIFFDDFEFMNYTIWYWRTDGNGETSVTNSISEFKINESSSEEYSNAEIYDSDNRRPYRFVTAMFNVCNINPTNGSRGWGLWDGQFTGMDLVWFMYMNKSVANDGLWAYVARNDAIQTSVINGINLSEWHNYTIVWKTNYIDFYIDNDLKI
ncbi:MAG: hypothetical protein ACTSR3_17730, partial [Candidatus Helarchaeota archaeon]